MDGAERDGVEQNGGVAKSDCLKGKGTEKWRKILVIAEEKMNLSRDAESK